MTAPLRARAQWAVEDSVAAAALQVKGMTSRVDPRQYRSGDRRACVVVPGVYEAWYFLRPIVDALHERGHPVHVLTDLRHNRQPVRESAELLARYIHENDLDDVFIAAHSKGGLIGKYAMLKLDPHGRVDRMVAIATPFAGSRYADWAPNRTLRAFRATDPTTSMLAAENLINHRITSVYGRFDPIIPESSVLPGATNVELPVGGHFQVIQHPTTIAERVAACALDRGWRVVTAESLTSGSVAAALGAATGAATWFAGGLVAYGTDIKRDLLGIAVHTPNTDVVTEHRFEGAPDAVVEQTVEHAIQLLRDHLG
jgi:triacylglycerol lipase